MLAAALVSLLFGSFSYFVFLLVCYIFFPKTTLGCLTFFLILASWIALTAICMLLGWITNINIPTPAIALLTLYPSFRWATKEWRT